MSAADYFRDINDADWRLARTFLYIGRQLWYVECVKGPASFLPANQAQLTLYNRETGTTRVVNLKDLPEQALFDAPRGYFKYGSDVFWGARGPVRDRHQGLKMYSMWYLNINGIAPSQGLFELSSDYVTAISRLSGRLQRKSWGQTSRDVLLFRGSAYYQGRLIGVNPSRQSVVITETQPTEFLVQALQKAGCDVE